jgi:putative ABC transport system permease protein
MNWWKLRFRSLTFHARSHLGTFLGAVIGTAVLSGALIVGDSVRGTLRKMALDRLGKVTFGIASGDRLFRSQLGREIATEAPAAAALQLVGTALNPENSIRANNIQILGVDGDFWKLAQNSPPGHMADGSVWLSHALAQKLQAKEGDTLVIRAPKTSQLSRDAPLSPEENTAIALRLQVERILADEQFGRFSLQASQAPALNAFIPLRFLQERIGATNQANLLLTAAPEGPPTGLLQQKMALADAQLELRQLTNRDDLELRSSRVFLDDASSQAGLAVSDQALPIFTYFVNELRVGDRSTPYSMVTAAGAPLTPTDLKDDEIVINQWLADDLKAKPGEALAMRYYVVGLGRELLERTNTLRIRAVIPMNHPACDRTLMPDFPGMSTAESCRDWDTGFPIKTDRIRDQDEAYWRQFRGTPKAFVTLAVGQKLWSNRFGSLTSIRYPRSAQNSGETLEKKLLSVLTPEKVGLQFQPFRQQALAASSQAQDFGGLFIGFSFFLVAAALILMSLLFRFGLEQRGTEIGTLLALGFRAKQVRRNLLLEGAVLAIVASALGVIGGIGYARAMLYALSTIWRQAIAGAALQYFASAQTLSISAIAGVLIALITIWWSLRGIGKQPARQLLTEGMQERAFKGDFESGTRRGIWKFLRAEVIGLFCAAGGVLLAAWGLLRPEDADADLFFSAGSLILIAGLAGASWIIRRLGRADAAQRMSLEGLAVRSITRRSARSRATIGLLACGTFLIASIGAFHLDSDSQARRRTSGTGGFTLIGETSLPVVHNLNTSAGREAAGVASKEAAAASFVSLRVRDGDEASCLNLNRAQRPRLLGVNAAELASRGAFTFSKTALPAPKSPWLLLNENLGPRVIPAIGDAASIQWAMGKKVGDELAYLDERGQEVRIRLVGAVANSILQGSLIISEENFVRLFPSEAGYRFFLIDCPPERASETAEVLRKSFEDLGMDLSLATVRLASFNAVQNTYLSTFQVLGGLGLLLGTAGLGVVLLRNVMERKGELSLLLALGFRPRSLRRLVVTEHSALLLAGMMIGAVSATVAILPALSSRSTGLPLFSVGMTLFGVVALGLVVTVIASSMALRGPLLDGLRVE